MAEVLAVETDDERREEQQRGDHRQPLHDLVLVVRDLRLVVVADAGEQVAREVEPVDGAQELVVGVRERDLDLAREQLAAAATSMRRSTTRWTASRIGRERAADVEQVVPQLRDPVADLHGRPAVDAVLELVDLVVRARRRGRGSASATWSTSR